MSSIVGLNTMALTTPHHVSLPPVAAARKAPALASSHLGDRHAQHGR